MNYKRFTHLDDVLTHFLNSNYDIPSVDDIFSKCTQMSDKAMSLINSLLYTLKESPEGSSYEFDLPGVERKDIEITIEDSFLVVKVSKQKGKDVSYSTKISLPKTLDGTKARSYLDLGVLTVKVPKTETSKPKKVVVE